MRYVIRIELPIDRPDVRAARDTLGRLLDILKRQGFNTMVADLIDENRPSNLG